MKKLTIVLLALVLQVFLFTETDETQDAIDALTGTIDLEDWDAWFRQNGAEDSFLPSDLFGQLVMMRGVIGEDFSANDLISVIKPTIGDVLAKTALLIGLAAFGAALHGISDSSAIGETASTVFRIGVSVTVLVLTLREIRIAYTVVDTVERTSELLLPAIIGYLTLNGLENTALLLPASHALLSEVVLRMIETCVAPLAVIGGVLSVLDANGIGRLSAIGKLLQRAAKWVLVTACSLYMLVTSVRSVAAKSADTLLLKTTKLAVGSIPAVGSLLSESVETAYQCIFLVRGALGLTGCAVLIAVTLKPIGSVFLTRCSLRASALLSEPLSGKPYAELLRGMGDTLHILMLSGLAALAMSLLMFAPVLGING